MKFELRKVRDHLGTEIDTLFKIEDTGLEEAWCSVRELDYLFATCVKRWGSNWDLEKVTQAIRECEFD